MLRSARAAWLIYVCSIRSRNPEVQDGTPNLLDLEQNSHVQKITISLLYPSIDVQIRGGTIRLLSPEQKSSGSGKNNIGCSSTV
jgi:hypothetical protein